MAKVTINKFDGGISSSERPITIHEASNMQGFDVFYDSYKLKRAIQTLTALTDGTSTETNINDAIKRDTDGLIVGIGTINASSLTVKFYSQSSSVSNNWTENTVTMGGDSTTYPNLSYMTLYKGQFYGTYRTSSNTNTYKYINDSSVSSIGSVGDYSNDNPKPIVHSQDNVMYVAGGKTISKYDGTTWTASAIVLPYTITSICEYGTYIAIACQAPFGGLVYLWGRDTSLTTLQDVIKVDSGKVMIVENLDGVLTTISETGFEPNVSAGGSVTYRNRQLYIRQYTGATMHVVKTYIYSTTNENGTNTNLINRRLLKDGSLYFSVNTNYLMRFGKNKNNEYILTKDMRVAYTALNLVNVRGFFMIGDYMFANVQMPNGSMSPSTDGLCLRTNGTDSTDRDSNDVAYYYTTINPSMPVTDRKKEKTLQLIGVRGVANSLFNGTLSVDYSIDNGVTWVSAISQSSTFTSKLLKFVTTANADSSEFPTGVEFIFRIGSIGYIDVVEFFYEYEPVDPILVE